MDDVDVDEPGGGEAEAGDALEQAEVVLYFDKQKGAAVEVTVESVHLDAVPAYYTIRFNSGEERETQREFLWRKGEERPPHDDDDHPPLEFDANFQPQQAALLDNGLEGTERVLVLAVDQALGLYTVRTRSGVEQQVEFARVSAVPVRVPAPSAAEVRASLAAALERGEGLTEWVLSITLTPMAKQGQGFVADDLPDDVRMWAAQEFVIGAQALMDEWHAAGVLAEGHWGVERGDENFEPHGQGACRIKLNKPLEKGACEKLKDMYRPLANDVMARAKVEFAARAAAAPEVYRTLDMTMRLSCNVNNNLAFVLGYTGKWFENDDYRWASVGMTDVQPWLIEPRDVRWPPRVRLPPNPATHDTSRRGGNSAWTRTTRSPTISRTTRRSSRSRTTRAACPTTSRTSSTRPTSSPPPSTSRRWQGSPSSTRSSRP